uniref:Uncharacterized mitochondrial protein AtMg00810-like n=1 Tax=Nicotiana tabacum TaxID=4097 RepID=A0A1S3YD42_TOBAC|nr:PREDICTED: uncharacterized mitochondrial protein AtMg00810-like [Nicotiana tabacum]
MSMMGELTYFLGLQIKQSLKGIFISQTKYIKELIKKFGMENAKPIGTPMSPTTMLDEDYHGRSIDETMYRGMIGSLLYLTASRPDIMFSVCKCARYQSAPKESHLTVVKRIIIYIIRTSELGLWYAHSKNFVLKGFSYADFAGDKIDRISTSGKCQLLGNALVSWHRKKQNRVALSTTEAEYLAIGSCCTQPEKGRKEAHEQTPKRSACKKGKVESTEFGPEDKLIFYGPNEKSRFESYKSKSMTYGRTVSLSLMKNLHCDVIAVFDFQRLSSLFDTIESSVYEEPVRMFYANLFVNDKDDLEFMVLGTRIVLDSY